MCRCWCRRGATARIAVVEWPKIAGVRLRSPAACVGISGVLVLTEFLIECVGLLLRWLHVVAAIAWIGESFYFVALDRGLKPAKRAAPGLYGESWSVHGGGFYHKQKYLPAPAELPEDLHWSKWKSYTTWLSGFALFAILYLRSPDFYLIDPAIAVLTSTQAVGLALAFLLVGWIAYDLLCRLVGFRDRLLGVLVGLMVLVLCYAATHLFAGRAAFLLVGAVLATIMSANVFFVIIPGQKRMVAALARGETPDPLPGQRGKQRSVHNTYFTLPVVFAMLSTHYATAFAHPQSWLVLALFMAAGALIRQFFVLWHSGERAWWLLGAGALALVMVFVWLAPKSPSRADAMQGQAELEQSLSSTLPKANDVVALGPVDTATIEPIIRQHCVGCHAANPTIMASAPLGFMLDTPTHRSRRGQIASTNRGAQSDAAGQYHAYE
jgi:uncharacterized membrane protein